MHGSWLAVAVGVLCMANTLGNGFAYDDVMVRDDPRIRDITDVRAHWLTNWWEAVGGTETENLKREPLYRPLTLFTFALNYAIGGGHPAGFHLGNIVLHGLACWLVWHFARRLTNDQTVATVAAVLFAVHPVHAEAVASIVGRAEVLAAVFLLAGAIVLLPPVPCVGLARTALSSALFLLALLAKETAICYPAVALLMLYAHRGRLRPLAWWAPRLALLLLPLLIYFPLRYVALDGRLFRGEPAGVIMNPVVMAEGLDRLWAALTVLGHYLRLLALPATLSCDYGLAVIDPQRGFEPMTAIGLLGVLLIVLAMWGWRLPPGPWRQVALLTTITIASYVLISNTVLLIGVAVAERLMYWPSVPVLTIVAIGCVTFWRRQCVAGGALAGRAPALRLLAAGVVLALGLRTVVRNMDWADTFTLAARDVQTYPQSAHLQRGYAYELFELAAYATDVQQQRALLREADRHAAAALGIDPAFADALTLRGRIAEVLDHDDTAFQYAEAALRLDPHHPEALQLYARLLGGPDLERRRLRPLQEDVAARPDDVAARIELTRALLGFGRPDEAREQISYALRLEPGNTTALRLLAEAQALSGRPEDAITTLNRLLAADPEDWRSHTNLSALIAERDPAAALRHAERAYALQPTDLRVTVNFAEALTANGLRARALEVYRRLLPQLDADDPFRNVLRARIDKLARD